MAKVYNPYTAQLSDLIKGNTVSHDGLQAVRGHMICDIIQQSTTEAAHVAEIADIRNIAQNAYMYLDGMWMVGRENPRSPKYGTNNPQDLYKLQAERDMQYKKLDVHGRICLFTNIHESDKECSERGLFEVYDNGFVAGRADLITSDVTDTLCEHFGNEYYQFVQGRVKEQEAIAQAKRTMDAEKKKRANRTYSSSETGIDIDGMSSQELRKYLIDHPELEGDSENLDNEAIMKQRHLEYSDMKRKDREVNRAMYDLAMQWNADGTFDEVDRKRKEMNRKSDDFELQ